MNKSNIITYIILLGFTLVASLFPHFSYSIYIIIGIFSIKFLLVGFQFMELKKAHLFWKLSIVGFIFLVMGIIAGLK